MSFHKFKHCKTYLQLSTPHLDLKKYSTAFLLTTSMLFSACGGSSDPADPTTKPVEPAPTVEPMSVTGISQDELIAANESLIITAKSANLTNTVLILNGKEISSINSAPFQFSASSLAELAELPIGRHEIEVKGTVDGKEQSISFAFKKDGEYLATYAAVNYVYENSPYPVDSITEIAGIPFTAKEGGWIDIAGDAEVEGTDADTLYTRELAGDSIHLAHQVSNGNYIVELHFAEVWFNGTTRAGRDARVFDVKIEDELVADDLDVFAEVGFLTAYTIKNNELLVEDGELNIALEGVIGDAKINAYSIQRLLNAWQDEDSDGIVNFDDKCLGTAESVEIDEDGCALPPDPGEAPVKINGGIFLEKDGLLVVEMESTDHTDGWKFETGRDATGPGYLNMLAPQAAWKPANIKEVIKVRIKIENPGRYQFAWRNLITKPGVPSTEHNDSYLKIYADNFYGQKGENIVCPKVLEPENQCVPAGRSLAGEAALGYFKIWRSGSPIDVWNWSSNTSDSDGHTVFAEFDDTGEYAVEIANRSDYHAIDRFVLFRDGNESNNVAKSVALDLNTPESAREP
ncbi:malectin domain-containing carbohydrate-binding protein [Paraglaciecola sp. L3A3]|uniref:malectin domain-containing carbohydrate-binding protein n=1 Tax=Paraglaciecola sp. L3A3 TaxID=2686358 RepID=UPI00131C6BA2|nr:malectin domain-containing carbohydrate-binding protein [Paraglaciecola sp. L3A3]